MELILSLVEASRQSSKLSLGIGNREEGRTQSLRLIIEISFCQLAANPWQENVRSN